MKDTLILNPYQIYSRKLAWVMFIMSLKTNVDDYEFLWYFWCYVTIIFHAWALVKSLKE